jgi:hypothetical protein
MPTSKNFVNLTGNKYNRLTVIAYSHKDSKHKWLCQCDCGKQIITASCKLKSGHTSSCGCAITDMLIARNTKHGMAHTSEYEIWQDMRKRCQNPKHKYYEYYGGKGISVCERWQNFENFYADMGKRPDNLTIDRIDSNGNYEPGNCKWSTRLEQSRNRKNSKVIEYNGQKIPYAEAAKILGLGYAGVMDRVIRGWSPERIMTTPAITTQTRVKS